MGIHLVPTLKQYVAHARIVGPTVMEGTEDHQYPLKNTNLGCERTSIVCRKNSNASPMVMKSTTEYDRLIGVITKTTCESNLSCKGAAMIGRHLLRRSLIYGRIGWPSNVAWVSGGRCQLGYVSSIWRQSFFDTWCRDTTFPVAVCIASVEPVRAHTCQIVQWSCQYR